MWPCGGRGHEHETLTQGTAGPRTRPGHSPAKLGIRSLTTQRVCDSKTTFLRLNSGWRQAENITGSQEGHYCPSSPSCVPDSEMQLPWPLPLAWEGHLWSPAESAYQSACLLCRPGYSQAHRSCCTWGCSLPPLSRGAGSHSHGAHRGGWSRVCNLEAPSRKQGVSQQVLQRLCEASKNWDDDWHKQQLPSSLQSKTVLLPAANSAISRTSLSFYPIFHPSNLALNLHFTMENETIIFHCL